MNLRQIEVFTEVMRTGSITEAAKALHVSQPSISKMIAYSESKLGVQLFKRMNGKNCPHS
ncbi:LysR family transcriptional regulator [Vibrio sinaloensis]|nr:LysR family transcriptional regulator [Vibrio sinaloensis]